MFCNKCGNKLDDGALFCSRCGNKLPVVAARMTAPATPVQAPAKNVAPAAPVQAPVNNVAPATPVQAPAKNVAPAAPVQAPVKNVAPATPVQAPVNNVAPAAPVQAPVNNVAPTTPVQAPVNNVAPAAPVQAPVNNVAPATPVQAPVNNAMPVNNGMMNPNMMNTGMAPMPRKPIKIPVKPLIIAGSAIVVITIALIIILNIKPTIKLNDFITVDFSGYDTIGTAQVSFDRDSFEAKYGKKIKGTSLYNKEHKDDNAYAQMLGIEPKTAGDDLLDDVKYAFDVDVTSNLSNGDVVTVTWDIDEEEISKYYKVKLDYSDATFPVTGLEEATVINPFDDVEVSFSGVDGSGYIDIFYNGNLDLSFSADYSSYLKTGDEVTVYASRGWYSADETSFIDEGIILSQLSKTYTVNNLSSYANSLDQIPENAMDAMKQQTADTLVAKMAGNSYFSLDAYDYSGCYFLTNKDFDNSSEKNRLYVIYVFSLAPENYDINTYGFFIEYYSNVVINPDGSCDVNVSNGQVVSSYMKAYYGDKSYDYYNVTGCETLDSFEDNYIMTQYDRFNVEKKFVE